MTKLADQHCAPCEGSTPPLTADVAEQRTADLSDHWQVVEGNRIVGEFEFKNYYQTQAFVNAVAYIAHREDHHPDISFGYKKCTISLTTHAIGGLSDNDFISAARIDRLLD